MSEIYVHDLDSYATTHTCLTRPIDEVIREAWSNITPNAIPNNMPNKSTYKAVRDTRINFGSILRELIFKQKEIENYDKIEREYYL